VDGIIIVDDASTDDTPIVAEQLTDPRARIFRHLCLSATGARSQPPET
jgi:glycosyltransferase involved in cell wall biosynthesis